VKIFTNSDQRSRASANQRPRAFTLIELLIVVGIIAILAAIAVPNFLESQVRAKISRVRSDMRTIAIAVESYAVDNNTYPFVPQTFTDLPARMRQITSPIAYLTTIPADPFARKVDTLYCLGSIEDAKGSAYLYNTGNALVGVGIVDPNSLNRQSWALTSGGPDLRIQFPYWPFADTFVISHAYLDFIYDPTNGTVSGGELFRRGGRSTRAIPEIDSK
jgi:type II secretion system protein G